jgi:acetophenone carboxylase
MSGTSVVADSRGNSCSARGQTWDDFHRDWDQLKPPDQALKFYGSWPDARKDREVIRI